VIALIDYKAGNLTSVRKALAAINAEVFTPAVPGDLANAMGIIVPGVGHFGATRALDRDWVDAIIDRVGEGRPLLGICLGMQWLYEGSEEAPDLPGLGLLSGSCRRLKPAGQDARVKVPHVGWNTLEATGRPSRILDGLPAGATAYFTHSYAAPDGEGTVARTTHGVTFASVVESGRVFGTQFHPEKSGAAGVQMLRRFVEVAREANVQC
jgi:glutamine amidotransferase